MHTTEKQRWGLVLAGGEGRRLHALTMGRDGTPVPKQFCSLRGGPTLVQDTLARMGACVDPDRTLAIVSAPHRPLWLRDLADLPRANVIEQPSLRGTAAGLLLPLLALADRDPHARLLVMPSDHHVEQPARFIEAALQALDDIEDDDASTVLLGISPDGDDIDYGWIVPDEIDEHGRLRVRAFVEKPTRPRAITLRHRGAFWNSFVMATSVPAMLGLFSRRLPGLLVELARAHASSTIAEAWPQLAVHDFSADVLAGSEVTLRVVPVASCGWTDLGTVARIAELRARGSSVATSDDERAPPVLVRRSA